MFQRGLKFDRSSHESMILFGPRGTGKTCWVREHFPDALYLDLLDTALYKTLIANPGRLCNLIPPDHHDWIIIDEVQKIPELMNEVHRLIEHHRHKFILTGSNARNLKKRGVNLLAGRALNYRMHPLTAGELGREFNFLHALHYGLLPKTIQASDPKHYLETYVVTYLREEVLQEGLTRNLGDFTRFMEVASFSQGNTLNLSAIARDVGIDRRTIESYFSILEDLLIANTLPVFTKRAQRQLVSSPKFYYFDVGVYRSIRPRGPLDTIEEIDGAGLETIFLQHLRAYNDYGRLGYQFFYWRTRAGLEVDFIAYGEKGLLAFEIKRKNNYQKSDLSGLNEFQKDYPMAKCYLIYGGDRKEFMEHITIIPMAEALHELVDILGAC
ncbi:MAG: AAA family ATPase [Legionellaceae bacterium]|nr:AAA family ATPase [Legionellaceae bacterium]